MKNPLGFSLAILATASLAFAGGDDEKKKANGSLGAMAEKNKVSGSDGEGCKWTGGPGKGLTYDGGDEFGFTLKNYLQTQYQYYNFDNGVTDSSDFDIRRARTIFKGHVYCRCITYQLQNDWTEDSSIKDAWVNFRMYETEDYDLDLRAGQMKVRYGREFNTSASQLEFIDRSITTQAFTSFRSQGAMVIGTFQDHLAWSAGIFNGDVSAGRAGNSEDSSPDTGDEESSFYFDLSYSSDPSQVGMGKGQGDLANSQELTWAAGTAVQIANANGGAGPDVEVFGWNIWGEARMNGFSGLGEFFLRGEDPDTGSDSDATGFQVSGAWVAPKGEDRKCRFGFGGRVSMLDYDDPGVLGIGSATSSNPLLVNLNLLDTNGGTWVRVEVNASLFHSGDHGFKTQAGVGIDQVEPDGAGAQDFDNFYAAVQNTLTF